MFPSTFFVTSHTDFVGAGTTFVAIQGMKDNGVNHIPLAISKGATTIVVQEDVLLSESIHILLKENNCTLQRVANCRKALAHLSAQALNFPVKKLKIIGITGTKGKTSTAFFIEYILASLGYKTALLSTVYNKILTQQLPTNLTTQHPDYLHVFFDQCVKANIDYVVMEVAAQAFTLDRVFGIMFDAFLFTNFDREHAEFYTTLEDYFLAKSSLLTQCKINAPIVINEDNFWCKKIINHSLHTTFGQQEAAHYSFKKIATTNTSSEFTITVNKKTIVSLTTQLIGDFNCYNSTGAFALCHALGNDLHKIASAIASFHSVPGRLERYQLPNKALCFIDYAHNPSSYQSVLSTLRNLTNHLIVVCGAGGDRDKGKRPLMGALATEFADCVIITSDNPRSEDPIVIIQEMIKGISLCDQSKVISEVDREEAIKKAYSISKAGSIIALLGKGPDRYQIVKDKKIYFNEAEIIHKLGL